MPPGGADIFASYATCSCIFLELSRGVGTKGKMAIGVTTHSTAVHRLPGQVTMT